MGRRVTIYRDYGGVPVDEGEAEAQPARPVVTVTHLGGDSSADGALFTFDCPAAGGKRSAVEALLHEHIVPFLQRNDLSLVEDYRLEWTTVDGERVRRAHVRAKDDTYEH